MSRDIKFRANAQDKVNMQVNGWRVVWLYHKKLPIMRC